MSNPIQVELGMVSMVADELEPIIERYHLNGDVENALRDFAKRIDASFHSLALIVSQHENKINALEYKHR